MWEKEGERGHFNRADEMLSFPVPPMLNID